MYMYMFVYMHVRGSISRNLYHAHRNSTLQYILLTCMNSVNTWRVASRALIQRENKDQVIGSAGTVRGGGGEGDT